MSINKNDIPESVIKYFAKQAGRSLDAIIAKKVIGWESIGDYYPGIGFDLIGVNQVGLQDLVPHYSTDISAAWEVYEKLSNSESDLGGHIIGEMHGVGYRVIFENVFVHHEATAETAPLAICRAALLAVRNK